MLEIIITFVVPILLNLIIIISSIIQKEKEKQCHEHLLNSMPHTPVMDKTVNDDSDISELLETCYKLARCNGFSLNSTREILIPNIEKVTNDNISKPKHYPTNCVNCGAILHGNQCEYCGTEYN